MCMHMCMHAHMHTLTQTHWYLFSIALPPPGFPRVKDKYSAAGWNWDSSTGSREGIWKM